MNNVFFSSPTGTADASLSLSLSLSLPLPLSFFLLLQPSFQLHSLRLHAGAMFPQVRGAAHADVVTCRTM